MSSNVNKKAAVLFSAGLDSTIQIAMLQEQGYNVFPITIDDDSSMTKLKRDFALEFWLSHFDLIQNHISIRYMRREELRKPNGYVPGWKLTMILSAMSYCDARGIHELHLGYLKDDRYPYPDEGPVAFKAMTDLYETIYGSRIEIKTLDTYTKVDAIKWGMSKRLPLEKTFSCRDVTVAGLTHCGRCDVCKMRWNAFKEAGYVDPAYYLTLEYINEPLKGKQRTGFQPITPDDVEDLQVRSEILQTQLNRAKVRMERANSRNCIIDFEPTGK